MSLFQDKFLINGPLSANWTNAAGAASIISGVVTPSTAPTDYYYNGGSGIGPNIYAEISLAAAPSEVIQVYVRGTISGNSYTVNAVAGGSIITARYDADALGAILETIAGYNFVTNDKIGIYVAGNIIRIVYNGIVQGVGASDSTYASGPLPGFAMGVTGDTINEFLVEDVPLAIVQVQGISLSFVNSVGNIYHCVGGATKVTNSPGQISVISTQLVYIDGSGIQRVISGANQGASAFTPGHVRIVGNALCWTGIDGNEYAALGN